MPTISLMTTVLPYSVDPADPYHLSLFFTHRLDGGAQLSDYPLMLNWVAALHTATFALHTDAATVQCTPLLTPTGDPRVVAPSEKAWQAAFPGSTAVTGYPQPKLTGPDWKGYPANRTPDHALEAHYATTCSCPVNRPGVSNSPLATELLNEFGTLPGVRELVDELRDYLHRRTTFLDWVAVGRNQAARDALAPRTPDPTPIQVPTNGPHLGFNGGGEVPRAVIVEPPRPRSPIEALHAFDNVDTLITEFLDQLETSTGGPASTPLLRMLQDVHVAKCYYHRSEEQRPYQPNPTPGAQTDRTPHATPDFHERAAHACNVPVLARNLGLVVDVHVDDLAALRAATAIRCDVSVDGMQKLVSPDTLCTTTGNRFLAAASTDRWSNGRLRLGDPLRYRVMDLDPDAVALALEQLLRSVIRALAAEANGERTSFAPATLRATGFAVAELDRKARLHTQVTNVETLQPEVEAAGNPQPRNQFHFEDLLRGTRVQVWDDTTQRWHSLHQRQVSVAFGGAAAAGPHPPAPVQVIPVSTDEGYLQNPPPSRAPGNNTNPYYVHEVLAGWDGWSLSAPRPGRLIIHGDGKHSPAGQERVDKDPEVQADGLQVRSVAAAGTLPALRWGRRYAFRIAGVDLAGNSVSLDPNPTAAPSQALITTATTHLEGLRSEAAARDSAGLLAALRTAGKLIQAPAAAAQGQRAEIEGAVASVVAHASSLRMHPQFDVDPAHLAALFGDSGDPNTVSSPRLFLRWDPVPAPALVPRRAYATGESLQRIVIRTGLGAPAVTSERHIAPPKASQLEAELDGRFDALMIEGKQQQAFATALKERGNFFHTRIQDLNSPTGSLPQPGVAMLSGPNTTNPVGLAQLQGDDSDVQPAEGQYVVHDVDQLVLPYLPDPMAAGVALVFYEAGADHRFDDARVLQSVVIPYTGAWPEVQPLRLVLHDAPALDASVDGNVVNVGLPAGEQVAVAISSLLDDAHLDKMGVWRFHPVQDPKVPAADVLTLRRAALNGWLWWLTPDVDLRLVHATARPAVPPQISRLIAEPRNPNVVTANLDGVLDVHGASTDRVELRARWEDVHDDPSTPGQTRRETKEIVVEHRVSDTERFSLLTMQDGADVVENRLAEVPIRAAVHTLPDTKARTVFYRPHGSTRYREFFTPAELPGPDDDASMGREVAVNVSSSAAPAPPVVLDVIPIFSWQQVSEPEQPLATRRIRRSGVRIWLDRPWFSSGDGEMLAVITTRDPSLAVGTEERVSLWARDPIIVGPKLMSSNPKRDSGTGARLPMTSNEVPMLSAWQQRAVQLSLEPLEGAARPVLHVIKQRKSDLPADADNVVDAYAFQPTYHAERNRWFVDVVLDSASAIWPFLRLSVARYQPNSIAGMEFSTVVATDFVQLPPERIGTVSRPEADAVRVSLTGVTAVTNAPGVQMPTQPLGRDQLADLLTQSRFVLATLQARNKVSDSDIDWVNVAQVQCDLAGVDPDTFEATWSAALTLNPEHQLLTPGSDDDVRVQLEEYEILSADPIPGEQVLTSVSRLVYADHFVL